LGRENREVVSDHNHSDIVETNSSLALDSLSFVLSLIVETTSKILTKGDMNKPKCMLKA